MNHYGRTIRRIVAKAIVRRASKSNGDYSGGRSLRQLVIADVMRRYPDLNVSSVSSSYLEALKIAHKDLPELSNILGSRVDAIAEPQQHSGSVTIVGVRDGEEAEFECDMPEGFAWDGFDEHDRVRWVREVALKGADFDSDCVYFRSPTGAAICLELVCQMTISDLCVADLQSAVQ